jgi:hypothetical protein
MKPMAKAISLLSVSLVLLFGVAAPAFAGEELVLIVSSHSTIDRLDSPLVRRLFLGLTVTQNGTRLRPVLNEADPQIKELFLQNIVSMSDRTYDRYVLRMTLLQGKTQPVAYDNSADLISAVAVDPSIVGYAWAKDVAHDPRIRTLRVLWQE